MGEKITSFRQLLRRASLSRVFTADGVGSVPSAALLKSLMSPYPLYNGYDPNGINQADRTLVPGTLVPYNYVYNIPFNWIGNCFVGMRGSSTWHVNCDGFYTQKTMRWSRSNETRVPSSYNITTTLASIPNNDVFTHFLTVNQDSGSAGQSLTNQLTQSGSSVTVPMYNTNRMISTDIAKRVQGNDIDGSNLESVEFSTFMRPNATIGLDELNTFSLYHNIGTDFNFFFFLNCPTVIISPIPDPTI